jgi:hypothetical protein
MKRLVLACIIILPLLLACGGNGEESSGTDTDNGQVSGGGTEEHVIGESGAVAVEDENICRVQMESLAMMLMNEKANRGSLPADWDEFAELSPAYAEMPTHCGNAEYQYEVNGDDFTITCPNGHGHITNDQASWSW